MDLTQELEQTVAGESASALFAALRQMERKHTPRVGVATLTLELPHKEMAPVARALMRIEAELLLEDASNLELPSDEERTPTQRRSDAFEALVFRTCAAMNLDREGRRGA